MPSIPDRLADNGPGESRAASGGNPLGRPERPRESRVSDRSSHHTHQRSARTRSRLRALRTASFQNNSLLLHRFFTSGRSDDRTKSLTRRILFMSVRRTCCAVCLWTVLPGWAMGQVRVDQLDQVRGLSARRLRHGLGLGLAAEQAGWGPARNLRRDVRTAKRYGRQVIDFLNRMLSVVNGPRLTLPPDSPETTWSCGQSSPHHCQSWFAPSRYLRPSARPPQPPLY